MSTKSATYTIDLNLSSNPPVFVPEDTVMTKTDTVEFKTSDNSRQSITITSPGGDTEGLSIPAPWAPSDVGTYGIEYSYKGGVTNGTIRVTSVSGGA